MLSKLDKGVSQYFIHIISLVTDNNQQMKDNACRNYYMINFHESMEPVQDQSPNPGHY